jgi:polysaccharide pyruvyl transferase WcaK-like protein
VTAPRLFVIADVAGPDDYHLGDEAMLEANLAAFRRFVPRIQFTVLSRDPSWTRARYGVEAIAPPPFAIEQPDSPGTWSTPDVRCALQQSHGVVISGGGNLCQTWPERILERVAVLEYAAENGLPAVVLGQTIGPVLTRDQRSRISRALSAASWIGVREEESAALVRSMGLSPERIHQQFDDAFFLEPQPPMDARAEGLRAERRPIVAITLDASFGAPYRRRALRSIGAQLDALVESIGAALVFVPHVGGAAVPIAQRDLLAASALEQTLRSPLRILDLWQPREVRWLVERAALVISTRYHPLIFAAAAAVPSVGIHTDDYTRTKLRGALAPAGVSHCCISIESAERAALLPLAVEVWHQQLSIRARLRAARDRGAADDPWRWEAICDAAGLRAGSSRRRTIVPARTTVPHQGESAMPNAHMRIAPSRPDLLSEAQWDEFDREGYLHLGRVLDEAQLAALRQRIDDIMLGRIKYPSLQMQLDTGGAYEDLPAPVEGFLSATLGYRKIQGLEADPLVLDVIRRDLFREICGRTYGRHASISIFRAMLMNKPAGKGTHLPWHQDAGDVWKLDRDPVITTWIALDPATRANGCIQVIPRSHRLGLLSKNGSTISDAHAEAYCPENEIVHLEIGAGEALLLHNWLLHRSGVNSTSIPRRAISACYMDGRTLSTVGGHRFPIVFGEHEDVDVAIPFVRALKEENRRLAESVSEATRYAHSLVEDNQRRESMRREAEIYAKSLEHELSRVRSAIGR